MNCHWYARHRACTCIRMHTLCMCTCMRCLCVALPHSLWGAPYASFEVKGTPWLFKQLPSRTIILRTEIPRRFPEKLTGRITAKDNRQTTAMSKMMWRWKDKYVTASRPHLLRISSSLQKKTKAYLNTHPPIPEPKGAWRMLFFTQRGGSNYSQTPDVRLSTMRDIKKDAAHCS